MRSTIAWLIVDPGCPWAYSARPTLARLYWRFGDQIDWRPVMAGLSESGDEYAARGIEPVNVAERLPAIRRRFGMPIATRLRDSLPATSRACRAVVAARRSGGSAAALAALHALQSLNFTTPGRLDSDLDLERALESVQGLDAAALVASIDDDEVVAAYEADRAFTRSAAGSPSEAQGRCVRTDDGARYTTPTVIFERLGDGARLEVGGFQGFDSYDTALANLEPALRREEPPKRVADAVRAFPHGATTAELASVLRRDDVAEDDLEGVASKLLRLADRGEVLCSAAGEDALWMPAPEAGEGSAAA